LNAPDLACSVPGCKCPRHSQGLCEFHHGTTPGASYRQKSLKGWAFAGDAWERHHRGHLLRITTEGAGYRAWIDGKRRGFYDTVRFARSHAVHLVDTGQAAAPRLTYEGRQRAQSEQRGSSSSNRSPSHLSRHPTADASGDAR
jgi:hypothetical protein